MLADPTINRIAGLTGLGYALFYLYTIGDIDFGAAGWQWRSVPWSIEHIFSQRGTFHFEAIAMLELGIAVILLSPVNIFMALSLGLLLMLNLHGALDLRRQSECRLATGGTIAALPALFAGGACCAPALLLLLGLPGLGAFIGLFAWLVPLSFLLLGASRWWQRRLGARPILHLF